MTPSLLNTPYVPATRSIPIAPGGNLQAALNSAVGGDEIVLSAGGVYPGNLTLPARTDGGEVIIRGALTQEGVRVVPSGALPKLLSPNADPALQAKGPVKGYRFVNVEVSYAAGLAQSNGLLTIGDAETTLLTLPSRIVFDRCYIHGNGRTNCRRGLAANGNQIAVIDSIISDIKWAGVETQAICAWNGAGPFKIVNCLLEASGENVMFGGADPKVSGLVPSDIEFRRNTLSKPLTWNPLDPSYAGIHWSIKNLFELKNAQRVLIEGNLFENNWVDAQSGWAIQFTPRNQEGTAPWSVVRDVDFKNNIVRHSTGGMNVSGTDDEHQALQSARITIVNNLFDDIGGAKWGGGGKLFQILSAAADVKIDHNTAFQTNNIISADGAPNSGFIYTNNLTPHNDYGIFGSGYGVGNTSIAQYFPGGIVRGNILAGGSAGSYPGGNYFPPNLDAVGFVDRAGGNYRLAPTSLYKGKGLDGKDIGADIDALLAAMSGSAPSPTPTPVPVVVTVAGVREIHLRDGAGNVVGVVKLT